MAEPVVLVVAAVVPDGEGGFLFARKTAPDDLAGHWEMPGGKVEGDEEPEQALVRELREELSLQVLPVKPLHVVMHRYGGQRVAVVFWLCAPIPGLEAEALLGMESAVDRSHDSVGVGSLGHAAASFGDSLLPTNRVFLRWAAQHAGELS